MAFSPDGYLLAVACGNPYQLALLDTDNGKLIGEFKGAFVGPINAIALTPDGRRLFTGGFLRRLQVWDVRRHAFIEEWPGHTNHVRAMAISPNGKTLVTGSDNGVIKFWSVLQRTELLTVQAHDSRVLNLTFCPDGCTLASAGMEGTVRLWRAAPEK
jgi:WD40 repeat protein